MEDKIVESGVEENAELNAEAPVEEAPEASEEQPAVEENAEPAPEENTEPAPAEAKEEQPAPEQAEKPKRFKLPKLLKNKVFVFVILSVLTVVGALLLFLLDDNNAFRKNMGIKDESIAWLRNIFHLDVSIITWLIFALIFGSLFFVFFTIFFRKPIKEKVENKRSQKTGNANFDKKGNILFNIIYWAAFALVIGLLVWALVAMFTSVGDGIGMRVHSGDGFGTTIVRFLESIGLLLFAILIIPLMLLALLLIYKGIVLLFGGVAGGIAKNVMASSNFQETYAAAQAASNRINEMANQLPKTISVVADPSSLSSTMGGGAGGGSYSKNKYDGLLFPALEAIDERYAKDESSEEAPVEGEVVEEAKPAPAAKKDLSKLIDEFQSYLVAEEKLYFSKNVLRTFIAGLSASRLILLEGLSGTGKSSLPRKFIDYIGGRSCFLQVQATWRDRTDIIGYFSDLTGYYKETELLKSIYESSYTPTQVNLIVLDEMNISRAEYYFADFLSIYEYPSEAWKVQLMQTSSDMKLPKLIDRGAIQIPTNIWFIGTINIDDSTFTITDKVYDRAIVINFDAINEPFEAQYDKEAEPITYEELANFFTECQSNPKLCLTKDERHTIYELLSFLDETFEIKIGNRIFNQIELFVPTYVGLGGDKLEAIDMMISAKIFRKLDLVFIMDMAECLIKLQRFLNAHFKKGSLPKCEQKINSLLRKYQ